MDPNVEKMRKIAAFNGIEVFYLKTDKFKTNSINFFFVDQLDKSTATQNALVPAVLRRGTANYPSQKEISLFLEELFGSAFDCGASKKGERQILQFYFDFIDDVYAGESLFEKAFNTLFEIITNPVLESGAFKKEYVEQEKENLRKLIEGRVNDKLNYAVDRCLEEMCKNEPYAVYEYGDVSKLQKIDPANLYAHYQNMLQTLPIYVFIAGNVNEQQINTVIGKLQTLKRSNIKQFKPVDLTYGQKEIQNTVERMNVNQGKLSLGFRTNISSGSQEYFTLMLYNAILGMSGSMHSKLFQNVREKESLAYYVFSRLDKYKGLMVISSGIEISNRKKAEEVILKQLKEIENGNITDYEIRASINTMETGINSLRDSQLSMVDFYLGQLISGAKDSLDDIIQNIKKVTKKQVINISKKIKLEQIYFLTSTDDVTGGA